MKTYKIHLLRHGRTEANQDGRYIGRTDLPLSPEGLSELLELKKRYEYPGATRFFTSPLTRCKQTLEVLYPGCTPEEVPGLAECDFGEWENKTLRELKADTRFVEWMEGTNRQIPGGESTEAFQRRVAEAFEELVNGLIHSGDTEAVVCTHGGVIPMLLIAYGLPRLEAAECMADSGNGFTLRVTPSVWMSEPLAEVLCIIPWKRENEL